MKSAARAARYKEARAKKLAEGVKKMLDKERRQNEQANKTSTNMENPQPTQQNGILLALTSFL